MTALSIVLPMAFVMVAGPQIVTAILLATGTRPRRDSAFFLLGAGVATFIGVTAAYFLTGLVKGRGRRRAETLEWSAPSKSRSSFCWSFSPGKCGGSEAAVSRRAGWRSSRARPRSSRFGVGLLLFLLLPGDLVSMFTVGAYLAHHGAPWWHGLVFVALTVALAGIPLLILLWRSANGRRRCLPKARDWMTKNSWIVSEIVIAFFLLMTLKDLLGG